jgi:hypothetical protein
VIGQAKQEIDFVEGYLNGGRERPAKSTVRVTWMVKVEVDSKADPKADRGADGRSLLRVRFKSQRGGTVERDA